MIENRYALPGDSRKLVLRPEDAAEVRPDWQAKVEAEIAKSRVVAFTEDGHVVALFGISEGPDFIGPWLLCSERVHAYPVYVMRVARRLVDALKRGWDTIGNYIGKHATKNREFIQALGFVIIPCPSGDHDFFYLPKRNV